MLTPELEKLKKYLEGTCTSIDKSKLLEELNHLNEIGTKPYLESLGPSSNICPSCGQPLIKQV